MRTKKAVVVPTSKHYNQQRMIELWSKGKSIADIAKDQDCSTIWARRVLSTKAPEQYKAGLEVRHAAQAGETSTALAGPVRKVLARKVGNGKINGMSELNIREAVEIIARSVASAAFSDAQLVPQPTTRTEMFANISKGVREGVKRIGFHT